MTLRMECPTVLRIIMLSEADGQLTCLPNVNLSLRVQQNIHPEAHRGIIRFGSSARTRTCESVSRRINSRFPHVAGSLVNRGITSFGSSARTRTWNPSVNSRMLYH